MVKPNQQKIYRSLAQDQYVCLAKLQQWDLWLNKITRSIFGYTAHDWTTPSMHLARENHTYIESNCLDETETLYLGYALLAVPQELKQCCRVAFA